MSVNATVTNQPITATVSSGGTVVASVPAAGAVTTTVGGGVGPQGIQGPVGPAGSNALANLTDVTVANTTDGDLLRYDNGKWRNHPEQNLVLDGENF